MRGLLITICLLIWPFATAGEVIQTSAGPLVLTRMLDGLDEPWGLAFLPGGGFWSPNAAGG